MPSETISDVAGLYDLVVEWEPGYTWLQVAVRTTSGHPVAAMFSDDPAELTEFAGLYTTLRREEAQQLITTLRQARDDIFGGDA